MAQCNEFKKLITCENVNMYYNRLQAVKDVSFSLQESDYLCIVGENGSGKSTLLKGLLGLMAPSSGRILFHGVKPTEIGYLPQQTTVQRDFPASVFEVVLSGCLACRGLIPFYSKNDKNKAMENIRKLDIERLSKKSYRELSGGQQQRVLLARALCATEKLLLLDEPTAGLDPVVTAEFYQLVEKLNREDGVTIVMVSHDISGAMKYASVILHMATGSLFFGAAADYKNTAIFRRMVGGEEYA